MDAHVQKKFMDLWLKYFPKAELPITFYYTDDPQDAQSDAEPEGHHCIIAELNQVRNGNTLVFNKNNIRCMGGRRYTGFSHKMSKNFPYFLSCGIPDKMEGERYKKDPELVEEMMRHIPQIEPHGQSLVFKRWDKLDETDEPEVVIVFADPDVLAGLFMLANFDYAEPNGVKTPMSSGCGAIIMYPYSEKEKENPLSIVGMFDPSARPHIEPRKLTFATPVKRFYQLIGHMEDSFLITDTWKALSKRMQ